MPCILIGIYLYMLLFTSIFIRKIFLSPILIYEETDLKKRNLVIKLFPSDFKAHILSTLWCLKEHQHSPKLVGLGLAKESNKEEKA